MFWYIIDLINKFVYILIYSFNSMFMLIINGSLPTISIYRLYKDTWKFDAWQTHYKSSLIEEDLDYISDKAKNKIIENFLDANSDTLHKINISKDGVTQSIFTYLKDKNKF